MNLSFIDLSIIVAYFVLIFGIGIFMERRAGKDLETYFLGGRTMPWWLLGMSGSSTHFDITGTMWIVSMFYLLGMRAWWVMAFTCFPGFGFILAYKAKWAYRSGVLTGVEWLIFRYGRGRAGEAARLSIVIYFLTSTVFHLGYAGIGVSKFLGEFFPFPKAVIVPFIFTFVGLYVMLGGFFSVVYSDFFQTLLLSFAAIFISIVAFIKIDPQILSQTVGADWFSIMPVWELTNPPEGFTDTFGLLIIMWVTRGTLLLFSAGPGGADFQRFRAARSEADSSKVGLAWGMVISIRWSLAIGLVVFGLSILAGDAGAIDSERVLPLVLSRILPIGLKGLVLAGFIAAFMSSFDTTINCSASFVVNDLVKPYWKNATDKGLIYVSYAATLGLVILGILVSFITDNIHDIWIPLQFALGSMLLAPLMLAPYWWRIGGWAHVVSGLCTFPVAIWISLTTDMSELQYFPILAGVSLVSCLIASYLFPAAPTETLKDYYRKVRPFGWWGPVRQMLAKDGENPARPNRDRLDLHSAFVGMVFFAAFYIFMVDIVVHNWGRALWLLLICILSGVVLYFIWWRRLELKGLGKSKIFKD
jgi:solute:Na+ symporter, SSS family